jgi:hypothetical protein
MCLRPQPPLCPAFVCVCVCVCQASYASLLGCSLAVVGGVMYADARKRADEMPVMRDMQDEETSLVKRAALGGDADLDSGDEDEPE